MVLESDRARRDKRTNLVILADRYVAVRPQIPNVAQRFERQAKLGEEIVGSGAGAVTATADARDSLSADSVRQITQPAIPDADIETHALDVAERYLPVEEGDRVVPSDDLHRANVEVAVLTIAFTVALRSI